MRDNSDDHSEKSPIQYERIQSIMAITNLWGQRVVCLRLGASGVNCLFSLCDINIPIYRFRFKFIHIGYQYSFNSSTRLTMQMFENINHVVCFCLDNENPPTTKWIRMCVCMCLCGCVREAVATIVKMDYSSPCGSSSTSFAGSYFH